MRLQRLHAALLLEYANAHNGAWEPLESPAPSPRTDPEASCFGGISGHIVEGHIPESEQEAWGRRLEELLTGTRSEAAEIYTQIPLNLIDSARQAAQSIRLGYERYGLPLPGARHVAGRAARAALSVAARQCQFTIFPSKSGDR